MLPEPLLGAISAEMSAARRDARSIALFTERYADFDLAAAYAVAARLHAERLAQGSIPVGRKIGFTNAEMWQQYGVVHPIWGYMYRHSVATARERPHVCSLAGFVEPRIEPEIALHLRCAPPRGAGVEALLECVDWCAHGFEIVQSHFPGWRFRAADTVADGALHGCYVYGEPLALDSLAPDPARALEACSVSLYRDGELCARGRGGNALGNPLAALAHLLAVLDTQGPEVALRAGEIVTTGTLTPALPVRPGETWHTEISGIALDGLALRCC